MALKEIEVQTHNGGLKQFNYHYIYQGDGTFTQEDYRKISSADQIRNASDYDDFYIASKEGTRELVDSAEKFVIKAKAYLSSQTEK